MIFHAGFTLLFLVSFQVIAVAINLPLVAYNVNKVMNKSHMCVFFTLLTDEV